MRVLNWIFIEPLRGIAEVLCWPFIVIPVAIGRGLWAAWPLMPLAYLTLSLATENWGLPFFYGGIALHWILSNGPLLYLLFRMICGLVAGCTIFGMGLAFYEAIFPPKPEVATLKSANPHYGPEAIDNFRDKSAYGDARHAQRQEISLALAGSGGVQDEPFFGK